MMKDDHTARRNKNNVLRKGVKRDTDCSKLSARICAIIAEKKRRKSGQRRICQGMCFSLPTPNDPFNDRHGKNRKKKQEYFSKDTVVNNKLKPSLDKRYARNTTLSENTDVENKDDHIEKNGVCKINRCPSAFLIMCLNKIQQELEIAGKYSNPEQNPLFCNRWGVDFWLLYSAGKDFFDKNESSSIMIEKIAWIASTAADDISEMEKNDFSFTIPFLLLLVPTVEKAIEVRAICKPLKEFGIGTVCLHEKTSIDRQIHGLKTVEPEFIISTPKRLLELLDLNAVDIFGISVMVIIGGDIVGGDFLEMTTTIRQSICESPITINLNDDKSTEGTS